MSHLFEIPVPPLVFRDEGIRRDDLLFRLPTVEDVPTIAPAFRDEEVGGRATCPFRRADTPRDHGEPF